MNVMFGDVSSRKKCAKLMSGIMKFGISMSVRIVDEVADGIELNES